MKICVESKPDGTYSVYQDDEGAAEQQGAMPGMPEATETAEPQQAQGQVANSLEDALQLVVKMFRDQPGGVKQNPFDVGMAEGMGQAPQQPM